MYAVFCDATEIQQVLRSVENLFFIFYECLCDHVSCFAYHARLLGWAPTDCPIFCLSWEVTKRELVFCGRLTVIQRCAIGVAITGQPLLWKLRTANRNGSSAPINPAVLTSLLVSPARWLGNYDAQQRKSVTSSLVFSRCNGARTPSTHLKKQGHSHPYGINDTQKTVRTPSHEHKIILHGCTKGVTCRIHANSKIAYTFTGTITNIPALRTSLVFE